MSVEVETGSPLALALNAAIIPKLSEVGWSTGGDDDSNLSEYIILMLANGKSQDEIAAELSGDLLNLGDNDPGAREFAQWLFQQVEQFTSQHNGGTGLAVGDAEMGQGDIANGGQDADMGDVSEGGSTNVYAISSVDLSPDLPDLRLPPKPPKVLMFHRPTGPKSMRNGAGNRSSNPRDKRMLGHLAKAMDRSSDSVLHRVRPQNGNERINTHRAPPTGPRQQGPMRGGPRTMNGRGGMMGVPPPGPAGQAVMGMNPQQQFELFAMLEQQSRMMAQILTPQQQQMLGGGHFNPAMLNNLPQQQQQGKSLFDRVQPQRQQNGFRNSVTNPQFAQQQNTNNETPSSSMDVQMSQDKPEKTEPDPNTTCRYNLTCTKVDCPFAHQSPAAPAGTPIDASDECSFGAACKNTKCVGRHPSPAKKVDYAKQQECKFFPNCTNVRCPFKHPTTPVCRNGADCVTPGCKFIHSKVPCKFNPCTNPVCPYKHAEGQRGVFKDKVWTADSKKEHVSERKFVDDEGKEELIIPGSGVGEGEGMSQASSATAELIT